MSGEEEKYLFWLCSIHGLGLTAASELLRRFHTAKGIYQATEQQLCRAAAVKPQDRDRILRAGQSSGWRQEWEQIQERGIQFLSFFHEEYPEVLRHLYQPPKKIMIKGRLPDSGKPAIGIVGARNCTAYGRDMARMFGYRLAKAGVQVLSGMALGIDGWSHQGALEGGGDTFAVLGSGVEVCYPARHRSLYESIQRQGGVFSEFPVFARAKPVFFPMRNRIISGLSDGILVVEARERSGSLITADAALEQGKDVFVIPGRIGDELSVGCNRLIRQGAIPVLSPEDILDYYGWEKAEEEPLLSGMEQRIYEYIGAKPVHRDELMNALKIPQTDMMKSILRLQKSGVIEETARDYFMKKI